LQAAGPQLLDGAQLHASAILPMWAYRVVHRALALHDAEQAARLLAAVQGELQRRLARIPDEAARHTFLAVAEHRILLQG